jgi:soluble P-type ATPase
MIDIQVPGYERLQIEHLVLDYNGTIAVDGYLMLGIKEELGCLAKIVELHIVTADTHQQAREQLEGINAMVTILPPDRQAERKLEYIRNLGTGSVVAIGNGSNDALMLQHAALGIAVIQEEGASVKALMSADIVVSNVLDAFFLLFNPNRLIGTLRA